MYKRIWMVLVLLKIKVAQFNIVNIAWVEEKWKTKVFDYEIYFYLWATEAKQYKIYVASRVCINSIVDQQCLKITVFCRSYS